MRVLRYRSFISSCERPERASLGSACLSELRSSSCRRYMKHKRDDGAEKQDEEIVDVTPIMICVFVVMCCSMLVLLYFFYDSLGTTDRFTRPPTQSRSQYADSRYSFTR